MATENPLGDPTLPIARAMNDHQLDWTRLACRGGFLLACVLGAYGLYYYFGVVRPGMAYWHLVAEVQDEIYACHQKRPADVDAKQWEEAVGSTMNIYGNVSMMTAECDMPFLQRFRTSLQTRANRGVDFDTLKWIWDELAKAGPDAARYAYSWRPVHLMAFEPITDETLPNLWGIDDCRVLDLSGARISDQGLAHLKSLSSIKFIYLYGTNVTQQGITDLQKALPNCEVVHDSLNQAAQQEHVR